MKERTSIFTLFGGIRPMARAIGESPSNVAAWKKKGRIPAEKQPHVLERGVTLGLPITAENVVFPLGRSATDVTQPAVPVACDPSPQTQRKG